MTWSCWKDALVIVKPETVVGLLGRALRETRPRITDHGRRAQSDPPPPWKRYRAGLRAEIAATVAAPEEIEGEIPYLVGVLATK
jgi:hypothetical protein